MISVSQALPGLKLYSPTTDTGVPTTVDFHRRLLRHPDFAAGRHRLDVVAAVTAAAPPNPVTDTNPERTGTDG